MPMRTTQPVAMATNPDSLQASGDFDFDEEDDFDFDEEDDDSDTQDEDELSGSGDADEPVPYGQEPGISDNHIVENLIPLRPEVSVVQNNNDLLLLGNQGEFVEENQSNVLMSQAGNDSLLSKTEVLAALIAGSAVGLMFAVLLVLILIHRVKKKDEGSYDLGKKPIYKKAPTTEIYA